MGMISGSNLLLLLFHIHLYCCLCLNFGNAVDTITSSTSINDTQALTSSNGVFCLGFFSLSNATDRYVGIWYDNKGVFEESVIWVANRNKPLKDDSGVIMVSDDGNLIVSDRRNEFIWSSNVRNTTVVNVTARILDTGNLVLQGNGDTVWESFRQPSHVFMPTMRISANVRTGEKVKVTSWRSYSDPSNGSFSLGIESSTIPQGFIWNNTMPYWRTGPWTGQTFGTLRSRNGAPRTMNSSPLSGITLVNDYQGTIYVTYPIADTSYLTFFYLDPQGNLAHRFWDDEQREWNSYKYFPDTECDVYGTCGAFAICDPQKPSICSCLRGFEPKHIDEWNSRNWTNGCTKIKPLRCDSQSDVDEYGFLKLERIKVPDFAEWSDHIENECKNRCLNNCSCNAYAYHTAIGCMSWSVDLIDIQKFSNRGIDLYIRLPRSELEKKNMTAIIITTVVTGTTIIIAISLFFLLRWMNKDMMLCPGVLTKFSGTDVLEDNRKGLKSHQLPLFKYEELATATINFESSNKIGEGGFGHVYKGKLFDGTEIAVKRLSRASGQGYEEFANEVLVITKLQHRNLVRLLGCCTEAQEKMLVYEYMPNKSLDAFLFDPSNRKPLDWRKRFNIIEGISRGLLYLHRDSRLRIIHRDLKASNILLDEEMNPKISDFGMARIFGGNDNEANTRTKRVVGTYGYMAPEYAIGGHFSEKSDVFSYGVLLLEIISGRRNTSSYSLLGYAWKLWLDDNISALADIVIVYDECCHQDIQRCIHIGLLCVQESAVDRPMMSAVISMLNSDILDLPCPKQPAFTAISGHRWSINDVTITDMEGR